MMEKQIHFVCMITVITIHKKSHKHPVFLVTLCTYSTAINILKKLVLGSRYL